MKLLGFMRKAIKLSLTELVSQEYIFLSLFRIDLPLVGQYGKAVGNSKLLGIFNSRTGWQIYDAGGTYPSDQG